MRVADRGHVLTLSVERRDGRVNRFAVAAPGIVGLVWAKPPRDGCETGDMSDFMGVSANDVDDYYADTSVPGEFRSLGAALGAEQLAVTLIRVPPHSDFEQRTGHYSEELAETSSRQDVDDGFCDEVRKLVAGSVVRVAPNTKRSHRNEGDEPVEMWAVSRQLDEHDAVKIDDFQGGVAGRRRRAGAELDDGFRAVVMGRGA